MVLIKTYLSNEDKATTGGHMVVAISLIHKSVYLTGSYPEEDVSHADMGQREQTQI